MAETDKFRKPFEGVARQMATPSIQARLNNLEPVTPEEEKELKKFLLENKEKYQEMNYEQFAEAIISWFSDFRKNAPQESKSGIFEQMQVPLEFKSKISKAVEETFPH
jgi:hypothetical protein